MHTAIAQSKHKAHDFTSVALVTPKTTALPATWTSAPACILCLQATIKLLQTHFAFHINRWDTFTANEIYVNTCTTTKHAHTQYTQARQPDSSCRCSQALQNKLCRSLFPAVGNTAAALGFCVTQAPSSWLTNRARYKSIRSANLRYERSRDSSVQWLAAVLASCLR